MGGKPDARSIARFVGLRLREARRSAKWTQQRLGDAMGVSPQQIRHYESGKNVMPFDKAVIACDALSIPLSQLTLGFQRALTAKPCPEMKETDEMMRGFSAQFLYSIRAMYERFLDSTNREIIRRQDRIGCHEK